MTRTKTRPWDAAEHLESPEDVAAYIEAAFEDGDPGLIMAALGDIARSRGMTSIAARAGLGRESLYKALSSDGNPRFATVLKVLQAVGVRLCPSATPGARLPRTGMDEFWDTGFAHSSGDMFVVGGGSGTVSVVPVPDLR